MLYIRINPAGNYEVRRGYYFYKQITRAGQPGMAVVRTWQEDSEIAIIGFAGNGTLNSDTFVVANLFKEGGKPVEINLLGTEAKLFEAYQTTEDMTNKYTYIGDFEVKNGKVICNTIAGSVTTFFCKAVRIELANTNYA
ncbi:hypothetical protein ACFL4L_03335 [bacterium]